MKKAIIFIFTAFFFIQTAIPAFAEDQFLETCLRFAIARNKQLAVGEEQIKLAKTRTARSIRMFFPFISFERQYVKGKYSNQEAEYQSESLGLRGTLTVYEAGRIRANYKYDNLMLISSKYNYTKVREDLFYKIKSTYFEFLTMKMEYERLENTLDEINEMAIRVRKEYKARAISELELREALLFRDKVENMYKSSEQSLSLTKRKLAALINIDELDDIPIDPPESLPQDVPEMTYVLDECIGFALTNNLDLKIAKLQIEMAIHKKKMIRAKVIPKFYVDGFYGRSGEADVIDPLDLATTWTMIGRVSWGLWGNSAEISNSSEKTNPKEITDPSARSDTNTQNIKLSLFDDLNYFIEAKEGTVGLNQSMTSYDEAKQNMLFELEKSYNEYSDSLRGARALQDEIELKERKLKLLKKRNQLYEVATIQVMEETLRFAETISSYSKAMFTNYSSVANMERMTLMPLR
ncbi:MAG: TolC family protein [Endomicrobiales bacterium]|nr:TolC family protein [Endomicrobiales bacterium]